MTFHRVRLSCVALCGCHAAFTVPGGFPNKGKQHTTNERQNSMTLDEILNGKLEQEIRQGMLRLEEHAPKNAKPCIAIQVRGFGSNGGFISADLDGVELGTIGYGHKTVTDAVNAVIQALNNPAALDKRRKEIQQKIDTLQTELQALEPMTAVMES